VDETKRVIYDTSVAIARDLYKLVGSVSTGLLGAALLIVTSERWTSDAESLLPVGVSVLLALLAILTVGWTQLRITASCRAAIKGDWDVSERIDASTRKASWIALAAIAFSMIALTWGAIIGLNSHSRKESNMTDERVENRVQVDVIEKAIPVSSLRPGSGSADTSAAGGQAQSSSSTAGSGDGKSTGTDQTGSASKEGK